MKVLVQCGVDHDDFTMEEWMRSRPCPECGRALSDVPGTATRELVDPRGVFAALTALHAEGKLNAQA